MGFTGTPLIVGEELTRQQFGDYVSIYNFRDAIEDGATVPLYYENRIPELQLVNEDFADELADLLEDAELDEDAEGQLHERFGRQYTLLTRPERLRQGRRRSGRAFRRRAASAARRCTSASTRPRRCGCTTRARRPWAGTWPSSAAQHDALPELRAAVAGQPHRADADHRHGGRGLARRRTRSPTLERQGLDIRPHRARMNSRGSGREVQGSRTIRCGWCSSAPCG